jgi:hypothetical protein
MQGEISRLNKECYGFPGVCLGDVLLEVVYSMGLS